VIDPGLATPLELHLGENPGGFDFTTASGHLPARRIRGKVINSVNGQPAAKASIVVVPRTADSLVFAPTAQSAGDGSFEIKGVTTGSYFAFAESVPPGDYKLFAWEDIEDGAWLDPDVMEPYESRGTAVAVGAASDQTVTVGLIR